MVTTAIHCQPLFQTPSAGGFRYFRYSCKKWQLMYRGNLDKETVDHLKKLLLHFGFIFGI